MAGSTSEGSVEGMVERTRTNVAWGVGLYLLGALLLWICLGWLIDYYVAETAEERYRLALRDGDQGAACINAGLAAEAYGVAGADDAYRKWNGVRTQICRR